VLFSALGKNWPAWAFPQLPLGLIRIRGLAIRATLLPRQPCVLEARVWASRINLKAQPKNCPPVFVSAMKSPGDLQFCVSRWTVPGGGAKNTYGEVTWIHQTSRVVDGNAPGNQPATALTLILEIHRVAARQGPACDRGDQVGRRLD